MNWALPSLHGGSLKVTEFVPHFLIKKSNHFFHYSFLTVQNRHTFSEANLN